MATLEEIETTYSLEDIVLAHMTLDLKHEAERMQIERAERERRGRNDNRS